MYNHVIMTYNNAIMTHNAIADTGEIAQGHKNTISKQCLQKIVKNRLMLIFLKQEENFGNYL